MLLSEHPAALAAPVSSSREGGVWSELLTILGAANKIRPGIAQAFTTRCWASHVFVWMGGPM